MTVTASAIFVREVARKEQEIDCHSALAILQKEPCSEGCAGSLREREIREQRGRAQA